MVRRVLVVCAAFACGCGPDVSAWKGTWSGNVSVNTGRSAITFTGTLLVEDGARFTGVSTTGPLPSKVSCTLTASTADGAKASFPIGSSCLITEQPAGTCLTTASLDALELTRAGDTISATGRGRATTSCTTGGDTVEDFSLSGMATR